MNLLIWGLCGKMGKNVLAIANEDSTITVCGGVDKFANQSDYKFPVFNSGSDINITADCLIDFSRPEALDDILAYAAKNNVACVLCTTGYTKEAEEKIMDAAKSIPVFRSANMSLGVNLMVELCKKAAQFLKDDYEIEIIEQHHNQKVDAPSGTALTIANAINEEFDNSKEYVFGRSSNNQKRERKEIGIHAVRGGSIVGKHDVLFIGQDEVVTIAHEAQSKGVFAKGAIEAAKYIAGKNPALYSMKNLVENIL